MAAGAGALQLLLGGGASYHGTWEQRPLLGCARDPRVSDINRALRLLDRATLLWLALLAVGALWQWVLLL
jgi:adenosylcobinamide-phosphate synthase